MAEGVADQAATLSISLSQRTQGYPYFLQEWGKHTWDVAQSSPITATEVEAASQLAIADLDQSFFLVRFDRLTPSGKALSARDVGTWARVHTAPEASLEYWDGASLP